MDGLAGIGAGRGSEKALIIQTDVVPGTTSAGSRSRHAAAGWPACSKVQVTVDITRRTEYSLVQRPRASLSTLVISMAMLESSGKKMIISAWNLCALLLLSYVAPANSHGQAAAEAAGAMSSSAGVATGVTRSLPSSLPGSTPGSYTPKPVVRESPPANVTNRQALEQKAGSDAAKLLLQSAPSDAAIYIGGMVVGRTPLLLIVAPGSYKVEMRGRREEFGEREIALSPNETQELMLPLKLRYPAAILANPRRAHAYSGGNTGGAAVSPAPLLSPAEGSKPADLAGRDVSTPEETNRKALEQRAGKNPARLALESLPSGALVFIDGTFVGRTPLTLIVPPGTYNIEMHGQREEFGERLVGILPDETQRLMIKLAPRYPARISVP